jgi:uncharacterized protein YcnI
MMRASRARAGRSPALTGTPRVVAATIALVLAIPAVALAHAVVYPRASTPGAYERYVLRVPNERNVPTTRVEIRFPGDVKVSSFSDVPGWHLEVVRDSAKRIVGAAWTGSLAPERFVEFPFIAVNPKTNIKIHWPAYQTYSSGERVEWTGDEGTKTPASVTTISPNAGAAATSSSTTLFIAAAALLLAFISLGLAIRRR